MKPMKTKDFERLLKKHNFVLTRSNGHKTYSNGQYQIAIPHDREVSVGIVREFMTRMKQGFKPLLNGKA